MRSIFLIALLAPPSVLAQRQAKCAADTTLTVAPTGAKLAPGAYWLELVATHGSRTGRIASGQLDLWPTTVRDRSPSHPKQRPPADTIKLPLYGATDVDFTLVGAPVYQAGEGWAPAPHSRDPLHPGVLVRRDTAPDGHLSPDELLIGTVANRRVKDRMIGIDGPGIYLSIRRQRRDTMFGVWDAAGRRADGRGYFCLVGSTTTSTPTPPETVVVKSGTLQLKALLWKPTGPGPFPAIVFNHGTGAKPIDSAQTETAARSGFGAPFQKHGYILLALFRRGQGLSRDQGTPIQNATAARGGLESESGVHVLDSLLRTEQLDDVLAGVAYLRSRPDVARDRVSVMGHSQGAMLAILAGARDSTLRAVVDFAGAEKGWSSPAMRTLLTDATRTLRVPLLMVHAENGNPAPGRALDEILTQRGVPHRLIIYPPFGKSAEEAHRLVLVASSIWEPDVFAFLDQYSRPPADRSGR